MSATAEKEKIGAVQSEAEHWSAEEILRWGLAEFSPHAAIASSFGAEDVALIDIAARVRPGIRVFTLDTDFLFRRHNDVENFVLHAETFDALLQIASNRILVTRIRVDGVPSARICIGLSCHIILSASETVKERELS